MTNRKIGKSEKSEKSGNRFHGLCDFTVSRFRGNIGKSEILEKLGKLGSGFVWLDGLMVSRFYGKIGNPEISGKNSENSGFFPDFPEIFR